MSPTPLLPTQRAAVVHGALDLRLESRPLWPPSAGEAQIAIRATGLCGSDLHYFSSGANGSFKLQAPLVLGHEAAGVVVALGPGTEKSNPSLRVGMRVAVECGLMCQDCKYCKEGRYNLCKSMRFCSSAKTFPHLDGTLQQRMNHPAHLLHPIPDTLTYESAALAEPLSVLLHASRRASLSPAQNVVVFGAGSIGLLACALARARGAARVVALDINAQRLEFAKGNGLADEVFCLPKERAVPQLVKEKTGEGQGRMETEVEARLRASREQASRALAHFGLSDGADVVFECTGAEPCVQMSIFCATAGGKVMLVGMGSPNVTVPVAAAATREVDVLGSFRYANTYREALDLLASSASSTSSPSSSSSPSTTTTTPNSAGLGLLPDVTPLITHRLPLSRAREAFELVQRGADAQGRLALKVMVVDGPQGLLDYEDHHSRCFKAIGGAGGGGGVDGESSDDD